MRSFDDDKHDHWQAAVMEASFGNTLMVFTRIGGDETLQTSLNATNFHEAEQFLADTDETRLRALLAEAKPWG